VHALLTCVTHEPPVPSAVVRQVSHASPEVVMVPGVAQYSVAHCETQGPLVPQMQAAMIWK
jgi:hypothetical protein